jgi:hypothetical protein
MSSSFQEYSSQALPINSQNNGLLTSFDSLKQQQMQLKQQISDMNQNFQQKLTDFDQMRLKIDEQLKQIRSTFQMDLRKSVEEKEQSEKRVNLVMLMADWFYLLKQQMESDLGFDVSDTIRYIHQNDALLLPVNMFTLIPPTSQFTLQHLQQSTPYRNFTIADLDMASKCPAQQGSIDILKEWIKQHHIENIIGFWYQINCYHEQHLAHKIFLRSSVCTQHICENIKYNMLHFKHLLVSFSQQMNIPHVQEFEKCMESIVVFYTP